MYLGRYLVMLWHGTDATFKTYLKVKLRDDGDRSLLAGRAFFPSHEDWLEYTTRNEKVPDVSELPLMLRLVLVLTTIRKLAPVPAMTKCIGSTTRAIALFPALPLCAAYDIASSRLWEW